MFQRALLLICRWLKEEEVAVWHALANLDLLQACVLLIITIIVIIDYWFCTVGFIIYTVIRSFTVCTKYKAIKKSDLGWAEADSCNLYSHAVQYSGHKWDKEMNNHASTLSVIYTYWYWNNVFWIFWLFSFSLVRRATFGYKNCILLHNYTGIKSENYLFVCDDHTLC